MQKGKRVLKYCLHNRHLIPIFSRIHENSKMGPDLEEQGKILLQIKPCCTLTGR